MSTRQREMQEEQIAQKEAPPPLGVGKNRIKIVAGVDEPPKAAAFHGQWEPAFLPCHIPRRRQ
jgi:hypothetical protein